MYVDEFLHLRNGRIHPETNSAIAKAGMECGSEAVLAWLAGDLIVPNAAPCPAASSHGWWRAPDVVTGPV
jgi:hypothetical protein